jgi:hypothetical protein
MAAVMLGQQGDPDAFAAALRRVLAQTPALL